jgi:hypothetical protein
MTLQTAENLVIEDARLHIQEAIMFLCDLRPSEVSRVEFKLHGKPHKLPGSETTQVDFKRFIAEAPTLDAIANVYILEGEGRNMPDGAAVERYRATGVETMRYHSVYGVDRNQSYIDPNLRTTLRRLLIR